MSNEIEPGTILANKYRIERVLGQGGMGVVVLAHHLQLDDHVAIKFLLPEALDNREAVLRFAREARAAVKIKSEHIARVTDVGTLAWGAPYMVMEYLRGSDLSALLRERKQLSLEDASDYLLQACEAIAEAHTLGIVHRDLKPPNLFLVRRPDGSPCIKVLDFGISKVTGLSGSAGDQSMTRTSAIMGSPLYMSPEQLASARDVDLRTDIWALGVILFELLTGELPFAGETLPQLCASILAQDPAPLRNFRPELPLAVDDLVRACLAKERTARVQTVADFAHRLLQFAPRRSRLSVERISNLSRAQDVESAPPEAAPDSTPLPLGTLNGLGQTTRPRATSGQFVIGGLLVGLAGAGVWLFSHRAAPVPGVGAAEQASAALVSAAPSHAPEPAPSSTAFGAATTAPSAALSPTTAPVAPSAPHSAAQKNLAAVRVERNAPAPATAPPVIRTGTASFASPALPMPSAAQPVVTPAPEVTPTPAATTPPARAAVDCDIPYYFDSRGNKVFKKGCL